MGMCGVASLHTSCFFISIVSPCVTLRFISAAAHNGHEEASLRYARRALESTPGWVPDQANRFCALYGESPASRNAVEIFSWLPVGVISPKPARGSVSLI